MQPAAFKLGHVGLSVRPEYSNPSELMATISEDILTYCYNILSSKMLLLTKNQEVELKPTDSYILQKWSD